MSTRRTDRKPRDGRVVAAVLLLLLIIAFAAGALTPAQAHAETAAFVVERNYGQVREAQGVLLRLEYIPGGVLVEFANADGIFRSGFEP